MKLFADHYRLGPRLFRRILELGAIWLILSGAEVSALLPGLLVVIPAACASLLLPSPAWTWRPLGLCRFFPFFLYRSLLAGIDVARLAFSPVPALNPALVAYSWRLPPGPARVFLANTISLLPGTLSVGFTPDKLLIHTLGHRPELTRELNRLEDRVSQLFKLEAPDTAAGRTSR